MMVSARQVGLVSVAFAAGCAAHKGEERGAPGEDLAPTAGSNMPIFDGPAATSDPFGGGGQLAAEDSPAGSGNDCGGMTYRGEVKNRLDLFISFDLSGSMFFGAPAALSGGGCYSGWEPACQTQGPAPVGPGASIFASTSAAVRDFATAPASSGIGVALRGFNDECDVALLSAPDVPMAPLPDNATAVQSWLDRSATGNEYAGTETVPALRGAVEFMRSWLPHNPDATGAILLVTDGQPDADCMGNDVAAVAADALTGTPSIRTYVLGLGNIAGLNDVALAGGTGQAFVVNDPASSGASITDQLNAIRGDAQPLPCEFVIPAGGERTPDLVNLDFTAVGATAPKTIPQVPDAAGCDATQGGWYYDDVHAPRTIIACEATCSELSGGGGQVDVALGCPTVVLR